MLSLYNFRYNVHSHFFAIRLISVWSYFFFNVQFQAFLYATVRCSALQVKEQQMFPERDIAQPALLPLCLCRKLCTPEQEQWWKTACSFYNNSIKWVAHFFSLPRTSHYSIISLDSVGISDQICLLFCRQILWLLFELVIKMIKNTDSWLSGLI